MKISPLNPLAQKPTPVFANLACRGPACRQVDQRCITWRSCPNAAAYCCFSVDLRQQLFGLSLGLLYGGAPHIEQAHQATCSSDARNG